MEPVINLKRQEEEVSFELCIICQETRHSKDNLFHQTPQGIITIKEATEKRRKLRYCEYRNAVDRLTSLFAESSELIPELTWHKLCYSKYTHRNNINAKLEREQSVAQHETDSSEPNSGTSSERPILRSHSNRMDWKLCLFCQDSESKHKISYI